MEFLDMSLEECILARAAKEKRAKEPKRAKPTKTRTAKENGTKQPKRVKPAKALRKKTKPAPKTKKTTKRRQAFGSGVSPSPKK